jgi:hypothetical protein
MIAIKKAAVELGYLADTYSLRDYNNIISEN